MILIFNILRFTFFLLIFQSFYVQKRVALLFLIPNVPMGLNQIIVKYLPG